MSQYFIRCPHCAYPHGEDLEVCPVTEKPILRRRSRPRSADDLTRDSSLPPPAGVGSTAPPPANLEPDGMLPGLGDRASGLPSAPPSPSPPAAPSQADLVGAIIDGRYAIHSLLGGGGMGAVFEGEQLNNGRPVAIKVLPFQMVGNQESRKRFFREAKVTAALSDANICRIYDYGALDDGRPYYVMERLRGQPLSEQIKKQGVLALLDAVEIVMQVLSGLRTAHKQGIVHRDVKPANVFLHERADGKIQVKLLDFGVAKDLSAEMDGSSEDTTQLTRTGCVMGTPFYLAPEQVLGTRMLDPRVDLWSVGVLLYECVAGRRPFMARNFPELASKIVYDPPQPLWERRPSNPDGLQQVISRALMKEPEQRYQTASGFLRDLQHVRMALMKGFE